MPLRNLSFMRSAWAALATLVSSLSFGACGADSVRTNDAVATSPNPNDGTLPVWRAGVRRVVIEIDYGPNAAPYMGTVPGVGDVWSIARANTTRLLPGRTVILPSTLAQMQRIEVSARDFSSDDIMALSRRSRSTPAVADTVVFHVMVLDGWYRDTSGRRRTDLLGGHLKGTGVIALFKPVIATTAVAGAPHVAMVVEQTTLMHELGHAVGLVDGGVTPLRDHHDTRYMHHCTNTRCVMNAWNEGATAARAFVQRFAMTRDAILFDADCLADVARAAQ